MTNQHTPTCPVRYKAGGMAQFHFEQGWLSARNEAYFIKEQLQARIAELEAALRDTLLQYGVWDGSIDREGLDRAMESARAALAKADA